MTKSTVFYIKSTVPAKCEIPNDTAHMGNHQFETWPVSWLPWLTFPVAFLNLYIKLVRKYLNIVLLQNLRKSLFILIIIIRCNVTFFIDRGLLNMPRNPVSYMSSECELRINKECGPFLDFIKNQILVACKVYCKCYQLFSKLDAKDLLILLRKSSFR